MRRTVKEGWTDSQQMLVHSQKELPTTKSKVIRKKKDDIFDKVFECIKNNITNGEQTNKGMIDILTNAEQFIYSDKT